MTMMLQTLMRIHLVLLLSLYAQCRSVTSPDITFRQCEPIRIEMCRGIGYNETSMPNLVGHELQSDVEYTLQTFTPLIEYVCSSQLKLFLCAAYVPMCTPKVPVHAIGPCRSLCESVRQRCHPVLLGFGYPWPPALDCDRFPKENNHETMCMEGPGEAHSPTTSAPSIPSLMLDCAVLTKSHLYVKLQRSGRCAPLCDADILFTQHEKHLSEIWVSTWTYASLGLAIVATLCLVLCDDNKRSYKWSRVLKPLVWCHDMVTIGWTVRFIVGRTAASCSYDPLQPHDLLLTVDGLSNAACASVFLLRYYFGMAACAWWAILCLCWHREMRRNSPDAKGHISLALAACPANENLKPKNIKNIKKHNLYPKHNNFVCFAAWGLPSFQTASVIVARLVDADELLGACFVGNQSDKGLQVLVATPIFCYWIFGSMNLVSGYLVYRRNKDILKNTNSVSLQQQLHGNNGTNSGIGTFLFIYGTTCALLLLAVIYEFANIDIWLNSPQYMSATSSQMNTTPLWPFLTRAFMELMLGVICFAWVLGPNISTMYKRQLVARPQKTITTIDRQQHQLHQHHHHHQQHTHQHQLATGSSRKSNAASSTVSYQTVRPPPQMLKLATRSGPISLNQMSNHSLDRGTVVAPPSSLHLYANNTTIAYKHPKKKQQQKHKHKTFNRYNNETKL